MTTVSSSANPCFLMAQPSTTVAIAVTHQIPPDSDSEPDNSSTSAATPSLSSNSRNPTQDPPQTSIIYHVSFNQDYGCFAAGLDTGFCIYNADPFKPQFRRDLGSRGGIGLVAMLFRSNIICLVGGGPDPMYPNSKVMIWDDHQSRCIGELSFRSEVKNVKLRRDKIIVILLQKIFVYNFVDLKLVHQIETVQNPKGLCEISNTSSPMVLVCPGLQKGQIRVENYGSKRTKFGMAHDSRIACMTLSQDGRLLATASSKGTLIRVFNTLDGSLLQEVRRGADRAEIYSLAFSPTAQWLAVSSEKGTVHVFSLKVDSGSLATLVNDRSHSHVASEPNHSTSLGISTLSILKGVLPRYFSSEWSVAQFRLPEGLQYFVAFGHQKNTVVVIGMDGSFYRCEFDPVVQANNLLEDQSQFESGSLSTLESGPYGTFVGVYDGHGGPETSRYINDNLFQHLKRFTTEHQSMSVDVIKKAYQATEEGFLSLVTKQWPMKPQIAAVGSCCLVGVICGGTLYIANLGDSRAVLGRLVRATGEVLAVQLSSEHNVGIESVRQEMHSMHPEDSHIVVLKHNVWRVKGLIQVSRSIGDVYLKKAEFNREPLYTKFRLREPFKKPILSSEPSIAVFELQPQDQFLIFASDGLWEHLSNQDAVDIVQNHPRNGIARRLVKIALQEAAKKREMRYSDLKKIDRGVRRHFHDDITVIVVFPDSYLVSRAGSVRGPSTSVRGGGISLPAKTLAPCAMPTET